MIDNAIQIKKPPTMDESDPETKSKYMSKPTSNNTSTSKSNLAVQRKPSSLT